MYLTLLLVPLTLLKSAFYIRLEWNCRVLYLLEDIMAEPDIMLWLRPPAIIPSGLTKLFSNLKEKEVLKPMSSLCFRQCQRAPLFDEFFEDRIMKA